MTGFEDLPARDAERGLPGFAQGEIRSSRGSSSLRSCGLDAAAVARSTSSSAMSSITSFWRSAAASLSSAVIMRRV